jgi:hypothetical protein
MMNAGKFLVPAVHEIAIAAVLAIATKTAEKPDPHALTDGPALDTRTESVDPPDDFVPRNARPNDWKESFHSGRIRMAHPTRLDANAYLIGTWIWHWSTNLGKLSRFGNFDCPICSVHTSSR